MSGPRCIAISMTTSVRTHYTAYSYFENRIRAQQQIVDGNQAHPHDTARQPAIVIAAAAATAAARAFPWPWSLATKKQDRG